MGVFIGLAISLASAAAQAKAQGDAAQADIDATARQAALDQEHATEVAGQQKAAAVRDADAAMATMLVGMSGAGGNNTVRSAVEIGFTEGVNIARAESNRKRRVTSSQNSVRDANKAGKLKGRAAGLSFVSSSASAGFKVAQQTKFFD